MTTKMNDIAIANGGDSDPMHLVDQAPELNVPVASLMSGFHLRQAGTDTAHVRLLVEAGLSIKLPPIIVQKQGLRIIDGLHRVEAAKLRGERAINARVIDCADDDALVLAIKSNTLHGLPLSRADRIASAKRILTTCPDWSDRALAGITGLGAKAIASIRNHASGGVQHHDKRLGRDGKRYPAAAIERRQRVAEYIKAHPEATIRQIARDTGVSVGTAYDVRGKIRDSVNSSVREQRKLVERGLDSPAADETEEVPVPTGFQHPRNVNRRTQYSSWPMFSAKLAADPALRYSDGGRAFLRWMAAHCAQADEWREFISAVPQHWAMDVSRIASVMSEEWHQFAEQLKSQASLWKMKRLQMV